MSTSILRTALTPALFAIALLLGAGAAPLTAATFTVSKTADTADGVCNADCSLREAIVAANAAASPPHTINFSIAGAGPHTITITGSALPTINKPVVINASGEAISGAPGVRLVGTGLGAGADGLNFGAAADESSVSYLSITGFPGDGIDISSDSTAVSNCYIGVAPDGTTAGGNGGNGVRVNGLSAVIGAGTATRNVISGNGNDGVQVISGGGFSAVRGNRIGTNAAGTASIPNGGDGVQTAAAGVAVGGNSSGDGNLISGNTGYGVLVSSTSQFVGVQGNVIGLNAAGTGALGNVSGGIFNTGDDTLIGSTAAVGRNVISGNTGYGITLSTGSNNVAVRGNYIGTNVAGDAAVAGQGYGMRVLSTVTNCTIGGTDSTYRNVISGASNWGITIEQDVSGCVVAANYIGTNAAGTGAIPNVTGVDIGGTNNVLGGDTVGERNVISGNSGYGVVMHGATTKIQGNYIGTNAAGTAALANGRGIRVIGATGGTIGGSVTGEANVISGNTHQGITLDGDTSGVTIAGNKVGTNAAGNAAVPNNDGLSIGGTGHSVGGSTATTRNLISGNSGYGIFASGTGHVIRGNYVGVDVTGAFAIGNGSYGLRADTLIDSTIGGLTVAEGNVFAGNGRGVNFGYESHGNSVLNNIIGLNAAATTDLADSGTGIEIGDSYDNAIGQPGKGNVIAGMSYQGIGISGALSTGNVIRGNWIGTNKVAASNLGNDFAGIFIADSSGNTIGGTGAGEGNVIAYNYQFGVRVERGEGNEISGNSIYGNFFGIDIDELGFFPNDGGDGDDGGNRRQNYPLISSAVVNGGATDVEGLLINEPNTEYRVEFFSSPDCGNAGFGQGKTFRGSTLVTTSGGGQAPLVTSIPLAIADDFLTATVTDPLGNTSEFSPCAEVDLGENPGKFQFDRGAYVGYEGILPTATVIVTRSHGLSGSVTIDFTTSDGSAVAGADYTDSDQTLTFGPWEVVKHVEVPILLEVAPEPDHEDVLLALSAPSGGATLGTPETSEIQIIDFTDDWPGLTVGDATVVEGDSGQVQLTFDVNLTATDHQVKVTWFPEPGSAEEGVDYEYVEQVITFPPSASTQTVQIQVPVYGDTDVEADEIVWLRITTAENGGNWIAYDVYGRGEIRNDDDNGVDPVPSNVLFADSFEIGSTALWSGSVPAP